MTSPAHPDPLALAAELRRCDAEMTSGPWRHKQEMHRGVLVADCILSGGDTDYIGRDVDADGADFNAADASGIVTLRNLAQPLADALERLVRERDEAVAMSIAVRCTLDDAERSRGAMLNELAAEAKRLLPIANTISFLGDNGAGVGWAERVERCACDLLARIDLARAGKDGAK